MPATIKPAMEACGIVVPQSRWIIEEEEIADHGKTLSVAILARSLVASPVPMPGY